MALSQPGADYKNRAHVHNKDPLLGRALDDVMDKVQAVANQTNASVTGKQTAPSSPTALHISVDANGFATAAITHENAPAGTNYLLEYSSTPNFKNPVQIDNGVSQSWEQNLKGKGTLYFRTAARFSTSGNSQFVYFGTQTSPTPITF